LRKDLEKYQKLSQLPFSQQGVSVGGDYTINRPIRILLYYEGEISEKILETLIENKTSWDMLENISGDLFIANDNLPLTKRLVEGPILLSRGNSLSFCCFFFLPPSTSH
jgi:hypothetical protein